MRRLWSRRALSQAIEQVMSEHRVDFTRKCTAPGCTWRGSAGWALLAFLAAHRAHVAEEIVARLEETP